MPSGCKPPGKGPARNSSCGREQSGPTPSPLQLNLAFGGLHPKLGDPRLRSRQARGGIPRHRDEVTAAAAAPTPSGRGRPPAPWHPGGGRACRRRGGDRRPGTMSAMLRWGSRSAGAARPVRTPGRRLARARRPPPPARPPARPPGVRLPPEGASPACGRASAPGPRRASRHPALSGRPGQVAHSPATRPSRGGAETGVATPSAGNARATEGRGRRRRAVHGPAHGPAPAGRPRPGPQAPRGAGLNRRAAPTRELGSMQLQAFSQGPHQN